MRHITSSSSFYTLMRLLVLFSIVHGLDCIVMVCSYNRGPSSLVSTNVSPGCAGRPNDKCPTSIHVSLIASVSSNRVTSVSDFVYTSTNIHISDVLNTRKQKNTTSIQKNNLPDLKMRARLQYSVTMDGRI